MLELGGSCTYLERKHAAKTIDEAKTSHRAVELLTRCTATLLIQHPTYATVLPYTRPANDLLVARWLELHLAANAWPRSRAVKSPMLSWSMRCRVICYRAAQARFLPLLLATVAPIAAVGCCNYKFHPQSPCLPPHYRHAPLGYLQQHIQQSKQRKGEEESSNNRAGKKENKGKSWDKCPTLTPM